MEFGIRPHLGVGPIAFGMTRKDVRQQLGAPAQEFMKAPTSKAPADAFVSLKLHVHYDADDQCEAVEFYGAPGPTFRGKQLVGQPVEKIEHWLRSIDPDLRPDATGLTSMTYGFGLYAPTVELNPQVAIEGVIAFRRGYYDDVVEPRRNDSSRN